jgi:hypothetical protein
VNQPDWEILQQRDTVSVSRLEVPGGWIYLINQWLPGQKGWTSNSVLVPKADPVQMNPLVAQYIQDLAKGANGHGE